MGGQEFGLWVDNSQYVDQPQYTVSVGGGGGSGRILYQDMYSGIVPTMLGDHYVYPNLTVTNVNTAIS